MKKITYNHRHTFDRKTLLVDKYCVLVIVNVLLLLCGVVVVKIFALDLKNMIKKSPNNQNCWH